MNYTKLLAEYVDKFNYDKVTKEDLEYTRLLIIDYFAAAYAGKKINDSFNKAMEKIFLEMGGKQESSVLFSNKKIPSQNAAILNAMYVHGADMDDGHKKAMGHVGAHVISAVFALGETLDVTEQEIIVAVIVGYEIYIRISSAAQPGLARRGFHSTGTAGAIACAAACAKLLKLNEKQIYNAMGIAVTQGSGLLIVAESGQSIKPINPAKAAQSGIISAFLAKEGVEGGVYPLESQKGWFHAMTDVVDENALIEHLGEKNLVTGCYFKPYPSCRHTHCGIEAAINVYNRNKNRVIKRVNLYIYENAIKIAGQIKVPKNDEDTKFSIHYTLACALINGRFGLDELNIKLMDEKIVNIIGKIKLINDPTMENREKGIRGAKIEVFYEDGNIDKEIILVPKGDPEVPFTIEDVTNKLKECCDGMLDLEKQEILIEKISQFGENKKFNYSELIRR